MKIDRRRKSLLILECDSSRLEGQNMALGNELATTVKTFFGTNPIELVRANQTSSLLDSLAELAEKAQSYSTLVVIEHSSERGIVLTSDGSVGWNEFVNWISPFSPRKIVLVACKAGTWMPCRALFQGLPDLKEIFASPILVGKDQKYLVFARILHILGAKKEDGNLNLLMQAVNFFATGGLMLRRTRKDFEYYGGDEGLNWNWIG